MTILKNVGKYYRLTCGLCGYSFELNAVNWTNVEFARTLEELGWTMVDGVVLCPDCKAKWRSELKQQ